MLDLENSIRVFFASGKTFVEWRFKEDGTKMYALDYDNSANSAIEEYELTKPWDIYCRINNHFCNR